MALNKFLNAFPCLTLPDLSTTGKKIKILHISPWFPEAEDPFHGVFIARHIAALAPFVDQEIVHIAVHLPGVKKNSSKHGNVTHIHQTIAFKSWRLMEWTYFRILKKTLKTLRAKENFTHVNFHIAYPSLVFYEKLRPYLPEKKLIIEHWSAYHFNFNSGTTPHRLAAIFAHDIQIATVSRQLGLDISAFAGHDLNYTVLPNVVDESLFYFEEEKVRDEFFMHALWKYPKDPMPVLQAVKNAVDNGKPISLRISGYGPQLSEMQSFVDSNNLKDQINFLGALSGNDLVREFRRAKALIMPTNYETFSVVVAEALGCGCPVIASDAGALHELVSTQCGIIKPKEKSWTDVLISFNPSDYDRALIAKNMNDRFSSATIAERYLAILKAQ